ncbi:MAG: hypothetical protein M0T71_02210 [Actinomycetota bacterium]|jgi:hypothetical protein|nr:hypothetical protein [Actinomycetota bacterium]
MSPERAELSSLASSLDQLTRRVTSLGEAAASHKDERVAGELFAVERSLVTAGRRLERLVSSLGDR